MTIPINHLPGEKGLTLCGLADSRFEPIYLSVIDPTCQECLDIQNNIKTKSVCVICNLEVTNPVKWQDRPVHPDCYTKISTAIQEIEQQKITDIITLAKTK